MSISATLMEAVRGSRRGEETALRCPMCGSFLDAPRINPVTGRPARKCPSCVEWHSLDGRVPDRSE